MRSVEIYLILGVTLMVAYSVYGDIRRTNIIGELGMLVLGLGLTMEETILGKIILLSGIVIYMIGRIDGDTSILMMTGIIGLVMIGESTSLLMIYIGIEIVGLSFYILAARERKGEKGTEAGIKYFVLGALSSGIMLMGITMSYAQLGTTELEMIEWGNREMIIIGILFKIGAAPFHMWVADVYEGASTIVTAYYAVVPKIAYLGILMKMGGGEMLKMVGIASILVGSIGAINQTKIKRMLGYSAIGHIGFMLIGIGIGTMASIQATFVYMIIYVIMTINSFGIVRNQEIEKIVELRGMSRRNGVLGMTMGIGLMSIAGVPPLAGFYNKYLVLVSAVSTGAIVLAMMAVIISVISGFYYVRIIRYMYFKDKGEMTVESQGVGVREGVVFGATTYLILTLMLYPNILLDITIPSVF